MKTLKDHTILYDGVCPMCNLYTNAFVKTGMLDRNGREAYQNMPAEFYSMIDRKRAVDEIPLIDKKTGEVRYGVDSLFMILGNAFPFFKPLFGFKPFYWLIKKIYKFISFNRRVIIPSAHEITCTLNEPSFNPRYRSFYLVFTWIITAFILNSYSLLLNGLIPESNFYREFLICGGQIFWQLSMISITNKNKSWDYLGNMMTISFAGALLLLIGLAVSNLTTLHPAIYGGYFMCVALLMLIEHIRRTKILEISGILTVTWVLYRAIILALILY